MDQYRQIADNLRKAMGGKEISIYQGIVKSVDGILCEVTCGKINIPDVRLRASEVQKEGEILLVPKVGSAVIIGSLSGDLSQMAVLVCDEVESIKATGTININGGKLGGLINIEQLTKSINQLVQSFNTHIHTGNMGAPTSPPLAQAKMLSKSDYEDTKIKH